MLEHRKVILHNQHHFTINFHPYNMDISALSSLVLRISTIQQQLQDNIINTQKVYVDDCGTLQSPFERLMLLRLADCFLLDSLLLHPFEAQSRSTHNMGTKHKIQIMEMVCNTNTQPVFRHTQPKNIETEADGRSHNFHLILVSFFPFCTLCERASRQ